MDSFEEWSQMNKIILKHLYYKLFDICKSYGINMIDDQNTINNFLNMMYYESNKEIIDPYFHERFFAR